MAREVKKKAAKKQEPRKGYWSYFNAQEALELLQKIIPGFEGKVDQQKGKIVEICKEGTKKIQKRYTSGNLKSDIIGFINKTLSQQEKPAKA